MELLCKSCHERIDEFDVVQATVRFFEKGMVIDLLQGLVIDLILKCPSCEQLYNNFIPASDLCLIRDGGKLEAFGNPVEED